MGFFDKLISDVGDGLEQAAAQAIVGETTTLVGGALHSLFGGGQTQGGQTLSQANQALTGSLSNWQNALSNQVEGIAVQLNGISTALENIEGDIADIRTLLEQIQQQQLYEEWSGANQNIINYVTAIRTAFSAYGSYTANYATTPCSVVQTFASNLIDVNDGPAVGLDRINAAILDGQHSKGLLQLWVQMVAPLIANGTIDYRNAINQYFQYYETLAYAELQATCLVMEGYAFSGDLAMVAKTWTNYKQLLLSQEQPFITWLYQLLSGALRVLQSVPPGQDQACENWMWTQGAAVTEMNPSAQLLPGASSMTNLVTYYEPGPVLERAEALLANLYVTGKARRVVVHMAYSTHLSIGGLLAAVNLTLTGSSGTVSGISQTLNQYVNQMDQSFVLGNAQLRRFVFNEGNGLKDDVYSLTNLNGTNGLVQFATYISGPGKPDPNFIDASVLGHSMAINAASPFAFMNFVAYATPTRGINYPWLGM